MRDPVVDLAEKVAEQDREAARLAGRVDAVAGKLRPNQAEAIDQARLPADLVATETNVWRRLSPARNRWPEIVAFDERVAELEMRQAAKADELRELRDREIAAPAADADRLATWQLDGEKGPRPEPELPAIREEIQRRQEEWEAHTRATARVLADKTAFVEKHRGRLVKEADSYASEAHARYLELVDQLAEARADWPPSAAPQSGRASIRASWQGADRPTRSRVDAVCRCKQWDSAPTSNPAECSMVYVPTPTGCTKPPHPSRSSPSRAATRAPRPTPSGTTPTRARSGSATNTNGLYIGG